MIEKLLAWTNTAAVAVWTVLSRQVVIEAAVGLLTWVLTIGILAFLARSLRRFPVWIDDMIPGPGMARIFLIVVAIAVFIHGVANNATDVITAILNPDYAAAERLARILRGKEF